MEDLGLMNAPALKGVTVFYPVKGHFGGERIPGGVYLAPAKLAAMKNALIFYDSSSELKKLFTTKKMKAAEINSRGLTPRQVMSSVWEKLKAHVQDCQTEKTAMFGQMDVLEDNIKKRMTTPYLVIVFLGKVTEGKLPELVIANDGIVKWLRENKLIRTYPTDLAYVNWAASVMNELKTYSLLGFAESPSPTLAGNSKRMTLNFPGVLTPGLRQLEAWSFFLANQSSLK